MPFLKYYSVNIWCKSTGPTARFLLFKYTKQPCCALTRAAKARWLIPSPVPLPPCTPTLLYPQPRVSFRLDAKIFVFVFPPKQSQQFISISAIQYMTKKYKLLILPDVSNFSQIYFVPSRLSFLCTWRLAYRTQGTGL